MTYMNKNENIKAIHPTRNMKENTMYRLTKKSFIYFFLVAYIALPATSNAISTPSCWTCPGQAETCLYYSTTFYEDWNTGCEEEFEEGSEEIENCYQEGLDLFFERLDACEAENEECMSTCNESPIIVNLEPGGFRLTGIDDPVQFDIDADGEPETLSWTDPDSACAFLVLDRNGNGQVDDGTELFGDHTPQPPSENPGGFAALGFYDQAESGGDGDGWISASDAVFPLLELWIDANHDGVSQPSELAPLDTSHVSGISLDLVESRRRDRHGNWFRWSSMVEFEDRRRLAATDVFFVVGE